MTIYEEYRKFADSCDRIRGVFPPNIKTAIILGSGLSEFMSSFPVTGRLSYADIPHFPQTTVVGHSGNLMSIELDGRPVYILQGRFHYYEGYSTEQTAYSIRVLAELGVKTLIITNSAGGISPEMAPGDLMIVRDHLSFFCESPLRGPNMDRFGPRFPDQTEVYDRELIETVRREAERLSIRTHIGVYAYMRGPQYETPAEIHALSILGASSVGMSTVPEAIVASHCGMKVVAISCISNLASGLSGHPLSHQEVIATATEAANNTVRLIRALVGSKLLSNEYGGRNDSDRS